MARPRLGLSVVLSVVLCSDLPLAWSAQVHDAAVAGDIARVRAIVETDPKALGARDAEGATPLCLAAREGHVGLASFLLDLGADVKAHTSNGATPLHLVAKGGDGALVELLIGRGATVEAKDNQGATPLHWASFCGNASVLQALLAHHADAGARARGPGNLPIHLAAEQGHVGIVRLLLDGGVAPDVTNSQGATALHFAAHKGRLEVARALLERGAGPDLTDASHETALHKAVYAGMPDLVALLIDHGASLGARDAQGATALQRAARKGDAATVRLLLTRGADANAEDDSHTTALLEAAAGGYRECVQVLLDHQAAPEAVGEKGLTPLVAAVAAGSLPIVRLLLDRGAKVDAPGPLGTTALQYASAQCNNDLALLLLDHGANPNLPGAEGLAPLHRAAGAGDAALVTLLLDRGADVAAPGGKGWTALHFAARGGHSEVAKLLIERGADLAGRTRDNWTPAGLALTGGHGDLVLVLAEAQLAKMRESHPGADAPPRMDAVAPSLVRLARQGSLDERVRAAALLADADDQKGSDLLSAMVTRGAPEARDAAAAAVGRLRCPGAIARLMADKDVRVREAAAGAGLKSRNPDAIALYVGMLSSPERRDQAVRALAQAQCLDAAPPTAAVALLTDRELGDVAYRALVGRGGPDVVSALVTAAGSPGTVARALQALQALHAEAGVPTTTLLGALRVASARPAATAMLVSRHSREAVDYLIGSLGDRERAGWAAATLAAFGDEARDAIPALVRTFPSECQTTTARSAVRVEYGRARLFVEGRECDLPSDVSRQLAGYVLEGESLSSAARQRITNACRVELGNRCEAQAGPSPYPSPYVEMGSPRLSWSPGLAFVSGDIANFDGPVECELTVTAFTGSPRFTASRAWTWATARTPGPRGGKPSTRSEAPADIPEGPPRASAGAARTPATTPSPCGCSGDGPGRAGRDRGTRTRLPGCCPGLPPARHSDPSRRNRAWSTVLSHGPAGRSRRSASAACGSPMTTPPSRPSGPPSPWA